MTCWYVLIIEEAHNIIGLTGDAKPSEENADPKAYATEFICRMLAECRGYEVAIVIIDQLPSAVAPAVIKHAVSLSIFRLSHEEDRETVGRAMLGSGTQIEDMGRLQTGEEYLFTEGYHGPRRIRTIDIHALVDFEKDVSDRQLLAIIRKEDWFRQMARQRIATELSQLEEYMGDFERQRIAVVNEVKGIVANRTRLQTPDAGAGNQRQLMALYAQAKSVRQRLRQSFRHFQLRIYRRYMPGDEELDSVSQALRDGLAHRFDAVIRPDVEQLLAFMDDLIAKFMDPKYKEISHAKAQ
jgi:hypothetical protein